MATKTVEINSSTWTAITTAGQSGTCWLDTNVTGGGCVLINHSTVSGTSCECTKAYPLYREYGAIFSFTADTIYDVYYAKCNGLDASVILTVDCI